jgi:cell division protein FtsW
MLKKLIKGKRGIWSGVVLLVLYSAVVVYSSSSNLAFQYYQGNNAPIAMKHVIHVLMGFVLMIAVSNIPFRFFKNSSILVYIFALVLIAMALVKGTTIDGASAERWINLFGFSFQPSELAKVAMVAFLARQLTKHQDKVDSFKKSFLYIILPIVLICLAIIKSSFSSAAFIFAISFAMLYVGNYSWKNLSKIIGLGLAGFALVLTVFYFAPNISNRMGTWKARVERFMSDEQSMDDNYQSEHAKMAILKGSVSGVGPGKSTHKYFLPQSNSDFIFAILVEEYGYFVGAFIPLGFYFFLFFEFIRVANQATSDFGKLLVFGLGFSIMFQTFINLGVASGLLPVTGQTLPLISAGGSSIWMTCISIGIILSVSEASIIKRNEDIERFRAIAETNASLAEGEAEMDNQPFNREQFIKKDIKRMLNENKNRG